MMKQGKQRVIRPELLMLPLSDAALRLLIGLMIKSDDVGNVDCNWNLIAYALRMHVTAAADAFAELCTAEILIGYVVEANQYASLVGWNTPGHYMHQITHHKHKSKWRNPTPEDSKVKKEEKENAVLPDSTDLRSTGEERTGSHGAPDVHRGEGSRDVRTSRRDRGDGLRGVQGSLVPTRESFVEDESDAPTPTRRPTLARKRADETTDLVLDSKSNQHDGAVSDGPRALHRTTSHQGLELDERRTPTRREGSASRQATPTKKKVRPRTTVNARAEEATTARKGVGPTRTKSKRIRGGKIDLTAFRKEAKKAQVVREQMNTIPTVTKSGGNFQDLFGELRNASGTEKIRLFKVMFERFPYTRKLNHKIMGQYLELTDDPSYVVEDMMQGNLGIAIAGTSAA